MTFKSSRRLIRRTAARFERLIYEQRSRRMGCLEKVIGLELFVPPTVMSPSLFRTGALLARVVEREAHRHDRVLDMGAGTGIVGLAAARKGAEVVAADKNPRAVSAARVNAMLNDLPIASVESDLFEDVPDLRFHLIAFNPPFFGTRQGGELEMALSDGPSLETLDRFCGEARDHLTENGRVFIAGSTAGALSLMRRMYEQHRYRWRTVRTRERLSERLVVDQLDREPNLL